MRGHSMHTALPDTAQTALAACWLQPVQLSLCKVSDCVHSKVCCRTLRIWKRRERIGLALWMPATQERHLVAGQAGRSNPGPSQSHQSHRPGEGLGCDIARALCSNAAGRCD